MAFALAESSTGAAPALQALASDAQVAALEAQLEGAARDAARPRKRARTKRAPVRRPPPPGEA